jgi:hypothetical protein
MPIGIADECAERIEPAKPSRIVIGQTASLSQRHRGTGPGVCGIGVNSCKTQDSTPAAYSHAVKTLALEKPMRRRFDDGGACGRNPSRTDNVERDSLQDEQIAPPPRNDVGRTSARRVLDQHVPPVNEHSKLRPLAARR